MLKALFFDMDGTLTRPYIDWQDLRQRVGVPHAMPIMAYIESLPPDQRQTAEAIVEAVEFEAAAYAELNPGTAELIAGLRACPLKLALITNSHRRALDHIVGRFGLEFDLRLSREDAPLKPAPDLLLLALEKFNIGPAEAWFVGDGRYDQAASQAAGIRYLHLAHDGQTPEEAIAIHALEELWDHLQEAGIRQL